MFTLITWDNEASAPQMREDQPRQFCLNMANNGGFYKVQIVNQDNATIEEFKA